jgi:hypothetical protein
MDSSQGHGAISKAWRQAVAAAIVLCLIAAPLAAQEESESAEAAQAETNQAQADRDRAAGYLDGELAASGKGVWLLSGLFLGPIGLVLPWVVSPKVPGGNLIGKSAEYVESFTQAYKVKARKRNFLYSLGGFGILAAVAMVGTTVYVLDMCAGIGGTMCGDTIEACTPAFCSTP